MRFFMIFILGLSACSAISSLSQNGILQHSPESSDGTLPVPADSIGVKSASFFGLPPSITPQSLPNKIDVEKTPKLSSPVYSDPGINQVPPAQLPISNQTPVISKGIDTTPEHLEIRHMKGIRDGVTSEFVTTIILDLTTTTPWTTTVILDLTTETPWVTTVHIPGLATSERSFVPIPPSLNTQNTVLKPSSPHSSVVVGTSSVYNSWVQTITSNPSTSLNPETPTGYSISTFTQTISASTRVNPHWIISVVGGLGITTWLLV